MNTSTLRLGATGSRVRELHERLRSIGFGSSRPIDDVFDEATVSLVEAFQRSRGLTLTGDVDTATWQRLVEAGWRLGSRLLYLTTPYLRGDDVADLQVRLSQLGFNPGRIDGLFGPLLHEALSDFQRNCEIPVDGTLTRRTLFELERVTPSATDRTLISEVTEMTESPTAGPLILWGKTDLAVQVVARSTYVRGHDTAATIDLLPAAANDLDASGVLVFEETDGVEGIHLAYWSNYRSYSRRGEQLASQLAAAISRSPVHVRIHVEGMGLPVLRETRMTTLVLRHGGLTAADVDVLSDVIARSLTDFFHN